MIYSLIGIAISGIIIIIPFQFLVDKRNRKLENKSRQDQLINHHRREI